MLKLTRRSMTRVCNKTVFVSLDLSRNNKRSFQVSNLHIH